MKSTENSTELETKYTLVGTEGDVSDPDVSILMFKRICTISLFLHHRLSLPRIPTRKGSKRITTMYQSLSLTDTVRQFWRNRSPLTSHRSQLTIHQLTGSAQPKKNRSPVTIHRSPTPAHWQCTTSGSSQVR